MVYAHACTKHMYAHTNTESNPDITSPSLNTHRSLRTEIIFQLPATLDVSPQTAVKSGAISLFYIVCVCVCGKLHITLP